MLAMRPSSRLDLVNKVDLLANRLPWLEAHTGLRSPIYSYELLLINLFSSPKDPEQAENNDEEIIKKSHSVRVARW